MVAAGRPDMAENPDMATNAGRVENEAAIDDALDSWCRSLPSDDILSILEDARVPSGPIYSVADMMQDPHFQARGLFQQVEINGKPLKIPAITPRLVETPGETRWPGGDVGSHNQQILQEELGLSAEEFAQLRQDGIIG